MKIIAFSDVHGQYTELENDMPSSDKTMPQIPECDVLIFAGDYSWASGVKSSIKFINWFVKQPGKHKILVPGNHDYSIDLIESLGIEVLINRGITIEGTKFFGSPYTPMFNNWNFMNREEDLEKMYSNFPDEVDVLITHGPPFGILDKFAEYTGCENRLGSLSLLEYVKKVNPKVHIFGHNHEAGHCPDGITDFYNVSLLDQDYRMTYPLTEIVI